MIAGGMSGCAVNERTYPAAANKTTKPRVATASIAAGKNQKAKTALIFAVPARISIDVPLRRKSPGTTKWNSSAATCAIRCTFGGAVSHRQPIATRTAPVMRCTLSTQRSA
eukprot:CAMPEP_0119073888 /NCGR_PEP_ID=MMETSP1178-20130426/69762_1 /TAXON_ID=33656 /ORGANISM="unid sp, Strain CCMP2000" /LENGTH=110 /DNA_ID=CAMNT_0007056011 /DNA_START=361 /DNA_END=693 /DNA_ORIENTATION=-